MVKLSEVKDISYSLPLFIVDILGRNGESFYSLDKILPHKICHLTCFTIYL